MTTLKAQYDSLQEQFHKMSDEMLSVWIEVAEHKLPNYRRTEEMLSVLNGIHAAKSVQRYRENNWEWSPSGGVDKQKIFGIMSEKKERMRMRKPSFKTVEKNLAQYARKMDCEIVKHHDGSYSLYDRKMDYVSITKATRQRVANEVYYWMSASK